MKEERDESNAQLAEKVNDINEMLQEISYLKEQMQLLHQVSMLPMQIGYPCIFLCCPQF